MSKRFTKKSFLSISLLAWALFFSPLYSCYNSKTGSDSNPPYETPLFDNSQGYAPKIGPIFHGDEFNNATLSLIERANTELVRTHILWDETDINAETWISDSLLNYAKDNGFSLSMVITNTPDELSISRGDGLCNPPINPSVIWEFAHAVTSRYASPEYNGIIKSYQIYSEPNAHGDEDTYGWAFEPWRYYLTFIYAADAIKAADPNVKVIFGGIANAEDRYLRKIYEINELVIDIILDESKRDLYCNKYGAVLGGICNPGILEDLKAMDPDIRKHSDIMAVHNYLTWNSPFSVNSVCNGPRWFNGEEVLSSMEDMVCVFEIMDRYNDRAENNYLKDVYLTEFGWSTIDPANVPPGTDEYGINRVINQRHLSEEKAAIYFAAYLSRILTEPKFKHIRALGLYEMMNPKSETYEDYLDREKGFGQLRYFSEEEGNSNNLDYIIGNFVKPSYYVFEKYNKKYAGRHTPIEGMTAPEIIMDLLTRDE